MKPYKHCFYDSWSKNILIRYSGETQYVKIPYQKDYYIEDPSGKSELKDVYGVPMIRKTNFDKENIKSLKAAGIKIAESDLKEEVKYLHSVYDKEELKADMNGWNICLFDIETESGNTYDEHHKVKFGNIETTLENFRKQKGFENLLIFDEEQNAPVKYKYSCYARTSLFPKVDEALYPINLITCYSSKTKQTYTFGTKKYTGTSKTVTNYFAFNTEVEMLKGWLKWFHETCFDVISGWNSKMFDIPYIVNRIRKIREQLEVKSEWENALSPVGKRPVEKEIRSLDGKSVLVITYDFPGLVHHDYMDLYDVFANHDPLESRSLNYVTNMELGEGKLDYEGTINQIYKTDWNTFTEYNVQDVMLLVKLENKVKLFPMLVEYAYDCLVTLDKIEHKVPTTEGYILKYLHNENKVLNDRAENTKDWWKEEECFKIKQPDGTYYYQNCKWENDKPEYEFKDFGVKAGYCYDYPGVYEDCMSFDITSSYPHHIMQFNISPEVLVKHPTKEQIESGEVIPSEVAEVGFRRTDDAILPSISKKVFNERKELKKKMKEARKAGDNDLAQLYDSRQLVKKLIINSIYGVCLQPAFHLFNIDCARSITRCARVTLRDWLKKSFDKYYVSKYLIKDIPKYFPTIKIETDEGDKWFKETDEITVLRNSVEMKIMAKDFNKETDLLGIE